MTGGTPVQSFVFLGLLVFELEPMYATSDRRTDDGRRSPLNAPLRGGGIIIIHIHSWNGRGRWVCLHSRVCYYCFFAWFYLWLVLSFDGKKAVSVQGTFLRRSFVH